MTRNKGSPNPCSRVGYKPYHAGIVYELNRNNILSEYKRRQTKLAEDVLELNVIAQVIVRL